LLRANQGHSTPLVDPEQVLTEITADEAALRYPACCHGSYMKVWPLIARDGLSRIARHHVHFTCAEPGSKEVISGMRYTPVPVLS
jgi:2'-phosphotransferase